MNVTEAKKQLFEALQVLDDNRNSLFLEGIEENLEPGEIEYTTEEAKSLYNFAKSLLVGPELGGYEDRGREHIVEPNGTVWVCSGVMNEAFVRKAPNLNFELVHQIKRK